MPNTSPHNFKPLTNRATSTDGARFELPADGFFPLATIGRAANQRADGTVITQVIDAAACEAMRNRLIAQGGEMLVDFDHESRDEDKRTTAAAWLNRSAENLVVRDDGLYGKLRLTGSGEAALVNGDYRFGSPEFADDDALLAKLGGDAVRPLALIGFALTNRPNFRRFAKPLSNREPDLHRKPEHQHTMKKHVAGLLGITETELDSLNDETLANRFAGIADKLKKGDEYEKEITALKNRAVEDFLAEYKSVIPAGTEGTLKEVFLKNRDDAIKLVNGFKAAKEPEDAIKNRAGRESTFKAGQAQPPAGDADAAAAARKAAALKNRASAIIATAKAGGRVVTWDDAWRQAEAEG